ncbi:MAG: hypothetical protein SXG53_26630 [Pseudomonadota bacterium]|nr:hypothetical protein [Pseudomonadota bacterium]
MSILRFTDGVEIDTAGEYRTLKLEDGWYVVGHGKLQPCADEYEALKLRDEWLQRSRRVAVPRFPEVHVQLTGEDGNVFAIIGRVRQALTDAGITDEYVQAFMGEITGSRSYDEALATVMRWVDAS